MQTGALMLAAGCGCPAAPSSSSSSTATVLWALDGELTRQETTSGDLHTTAVQGQEPKNTGFVSESFGLLLLVCINVIVVFVVNTSFRQ